MLVQLSDSVLMILHRRDQKTSTERVLYSNLESKQYMAKTCAKTYAISSIISIGIVSLCL